MERLTEILERATAAIAAPCFLLPIDGGDSIYRERVYCYELYHQLRTAWPEECPYLLNGEVDKAGHPILRTMGADHAKPDLLVHGPGDMALNHAVIEVKPERASNDAIATDLAKLDLFVRTVRYQRAIYLIYGYDGKQSAERIVEVARAGPPLSPIEVWLHAAPGVAARKQGTLAYLVAAGNQFIAAAEAEVRHD